MLKRVFLITFKHKSIDIHLLNTLQLGDKASVIHSELDQDIQFSELLRKMRNSALKSIENDLCIRITVQGY